MKVRRLRDWYEQKARTYDREGEQKFFLDPSPERKGFRTLAKIRVNQSVLDVGTGTGRYIIPLIRKGVKCYGIDFSPAMLTELRRKLANKPYRKQVASLCVGDARHLPYHSNRFDWTICLGVLEYYPISIRIKILRNMWKVLVDEGKAVIDMPNDASPLARAFQIAERLAGNTVFLYPFHVLHQAIKDGGFRVLKKQVAGMEWQFLLEKDDCSWIE